MRSASAWTAAVALAMLAAAAAYLGAFLHAGFSDGPRTAEAAHRVRRDTLALRGIVIREERLLPPEEKPVYLTAADGVRVAAGRTLGIRGESGEELFRGWLLQRLREESAPPVSAAAALRSLRGALAAADFDAAALNAAALETSLLSDGADARDLAGEIAALEAVGASEAVLTAPASGFFLRATDGWEGLSPADAGTLTVEAIETVLRRGAEPTSAPGKLVTGSLWLFAAPVGAGEAARFSPGETVALTLCGERVEAEVRRIIRGGAGGAVVFACRTGLDAVLSVREAAAEALLSETEGLALPAEAIREDGGGTFVFRVAGPYARRETVTVLSVRDGEALVVSDALREGSLVLLGGEYADGMLIGR